MKKSLLALLFTGSVIGASHSYTAYQYNIDKQCNGATAELVIEGKQLHNKKVVLNCNGQELTVRSVEVVHTIDPASRSTVVGAFARKESLN